MQDLGQLIQLPIRKRSCSPLYSHNLSNTSHLDAAAFSSFDISPPRLTTWHPPTVADATAKTTMCKPAWCGGCLARCQCWWTWSGSVRGMAVLGIAAHAPGCILINGAITQYTASEAWRRSVRAICDSWLIGQELDGIFLDSPNN
jgi:hypothetical protein